MVIGGFRQVAVVLLAGVLAGFTPVPAAVGDHRPERLAQAFLSVVFGLEYGSRHNDSQRVKKYVDPVRFHVTDLSSARRGAEARAFLASLPSRIRNLRAGLVPRPEDANFRVFLVDRAEFNRVVLEELNADAIAMGARCIVGVKTQGGRILASTAVIVADDEYLFRRCLVEEVLQGLGPMNDSDSLEESVFNDASRHASFTAFDEALLNMLYHPSIRPGMTGSQVQRMLPRVLADLGLHR